MAGTVIAELLVKIGVDISDFGRQLEGVTSSFDKFGSQMTSMGAALTAGISAPIVGAGAAVLKFSTDFEKSMTRVAVLGDLTTPQLKILEALAIKLGKDTVFSAKQAADAMGELAAQGYRTNEIVAAMPGVLGLAASGQVSLAEAAQVSSDIMKGFQMGADQAGRVADVLAKAAADSSLSVTSLGYAFKYVGPVASATGASFEEVTAALQIMADAGIRGEKAGSGMVQFFLDLIAPSGKAAKSMEEMGISVLDAQGKMRAFPDLINQINASQKLYGTQTEWVSALSKIWGARVADILPVLQAGGDKVAAIADGLRNSSGAAELMGQKLMDNVAGSFEQLSGSIETFGIVAGKIIAPTIRAAVDGLTALVNKVTEVAERLAGLPQGLKDFLVYAAAFAAAIGPIVMAIGLFSTGLATLAPAFGMLKTGGLLIAEFGIKAASLGPILAKMAGDMVAFASLAKAHGIAGAIDAAFNINLAMVKTSMLQFVEAAKVMIMSGITPIVAGFKAMYAAIASQGLIGALSSARVAFVAFGVSVNVSLGVIALVIAAIAALVAAGIWLYKNWDEVSKVLAALWTDLKNLFIAAFTAYIDFLKTFWGGILNLLIAPFRAAWDALVFIWESIKNAAIAVFTTVIDFFKGVFGENLLKGWATAWQGFKDLLTSVWNAIASATEFIWRPVVNFFSTIWNAVGGYFIGVWTGIKDWLSNLWGNIADIAKGVWSWIVEKIQWALDKLSSIFPETTKALANWGKQMDSTTPKIKEVGKSSSDAASSSSSLASAASKAAAQFAALGKSAGGLGPPLESANKQLALSHDELKRQGKAAIEASSSWSKLLPVIQATAKSYSEFESIAAKGVAQRQLDQMQATLQKNMQHWLYLDDSAKRHMTTLSQVINQYQDWMAKFKAASLTAEMEKMAEAINKSLANTMRNVKELSEKAPSVIRDWNKELTNTLPVWDDLQQSTRRTTDGIANLRDVSLHASDQVTNAWTATAKRFDDISSNLNKSVASSVSGILSGIGDIITKGGSLGEVFTRAWDEVKRSFARAMQDMSRALIEEFVEKGLERALKSMGDLGGATEVLGRKVAEVFGTGADAAKTVSKTGAPTTPTPGAPPTAALSGLTGTLTLVATAVDAVASVLQYLQGRRMEQDIGRIEVTSRQIFAEVSNLRKDEWDRHSFFADRTSDIWNQIRASCGDIVVAIRDLIDVQRTQTKATTNVVMQRDDGDTLADIMLSGVRIVSKIADYLQSALPDVVDYLASISSYLNTSLRYDMQELLKYEQSNSNSLAAAAVTLKALFEKLGGSLATPVTSALPGAANAFPAGAPTSTFSSTSLQLQVAVNNADAGRVANEMVSRWRHMGVDI